MVSSGMVKIVVSKIDRRREKVKREDFLTSGTDGTVGRADRYDTYAPNICCPEYPVTIIIITGQGHGSRVEL